MKKLRIISLMLPLIDALLTVLALKVDFVPIIHNILVTFTFFISPVIEAIIVGMMSDKVKNKVYRFLLIMLTIFIVIIWFPMMLLGLFGIKEIYASFRYDNITYYAFNVTFIHPVYVIYKKVSPFTMKELTYEDSKTLIIKRSEFKNISNDGYIDVLVEYFNSY